jgi:glycosyltransferase involved in cell wall biosynthesis
MEGRITVELAGYLDAAVGVGEAARRYVEALRSVGVQVLERDVSLPGRDSAMSEPSAGSIVDPEKVGFNLLCLNPEQMVPYLHGPDSPTGAGRKTVGVWSWEVDVLPPGWRAAASEVTEVWTYSRFAARFIAREIGAPVVAIPPPVSAAAEPVPLSIRLPRGFRVLVMFDYLSTLERKNPLGAITAFRRAFRPEDGAVLVVKSVNGQHRPERQAELADAVQGRPDIVLVDQTMSGAERDALVAGCDCYLSLHRSEGHGLPLAEAMASGKPVVATAYGGNVEFMNEGNSYPVAWTPAPVGEGVEHYPASATWAEPDIEHAAHQLEMIRRHPEDSQRRAAQGRLDVGALLAPETVGAQMCSRLAERASGHGRRYLRRLVGK